MENGLNQAKFKFYWIYAVITAFVFFIYYLMQPTDIENRVFLKYSLIRLGIMSVFVLLIIFSSLMFLSFVRKDKLSRKIAPILNSSIFSTISMNLFLLFLIVIILFLLPPLRYHAFAPRLFPLAIFTFLVFTGLVVSLKWLLGRHVWLDFKQNWHSVIVWLKSKSEKGLCVLQNVIEGRFFYIIAVLMAFPIVFAIPGHYDFPSGYAGLFSLISETIIENGFTYPVDIPFYGPGGIPFAYPPLAFYIMAFFTWVFHISTLDYVRIAPSIFLLLAVIPFAKLVQRITKSKIAGIVAPVIIVGAQQIFELIGTSGGIVRGFAFLTASWGMYFLATAVEEEDYKFHGLLASVFCALTALTHFTMLALIVVFAISLLLTHLLKPRKWFILASVGVASMVFVTPWVIYIIHQYGVDVFSYAATSHDTAYFLFLIQHPDRILPSTIDAFNSIYEMKYYFGLLLVGFLVSWSEKKIPPIWFILIILFFQQDDHFIVVVGAVLIGILIGVLYDSIKGNTTNNKKYQSIVFLAIVLIFLGIVGQNIILNNNKPKISKYSYQVAEYIQQSYDEKSTYLVITNAEEAEWFPYLLKRTPVMGSWGAEWIGTYRDQFGLLMDLDNCIGLQSFTCVDSLLAKNRLSPKIIISKVEQVEMEKAMIDSSIVKLVYENREYVVWEYQP